MSKLVLFVNHYRLDIPGRDRKRPRRRHEDIERLEKRQEEIDFCLAQNRRIFDKIVLFDHRPRYNDFFNETSRFKNEVNVLANADIYFNHTAELLHLIKPNECFALTRWEDTEQGIQKFEQCNFYNRAAQARFSQDAWIFRGQVRGVSGNFYLGVPGCDNRIAWEISRSYQVYNPCESIQAIHRHRDANRNYQIPGDSEPKIPKPYTFINPCRIENGEYVPLADTEYRGPVYHRVNYPPR